MKLLALPLLSGLAGATLENFKEMFSSMNGMEPETVDDAERRRAADYQELCGDVGCYATQPIMDWMSNDEAMEICARTCMTWHPVNKSPQGGWWDPPTVKGRRSICACSGHKSRPAHQIPDPPNHEDGRFALGLTWEGDPLAFDKCSFACDRHPDKPFATGRWWYKAVEDPELRRYLGTLWGFGSYCECRAPDPSKAYVEAGKSVCKGHDEDYAAEDIEEKGWLMAKPYWGWGFHEGQGWRKCTGYSMTVEKCALLCTSLGKCSHFSVANTCCFVYSFSNPSCEPDTNPSAMERYTYYKMRNELNTATYTEMHHAMENEEFEDESEREAFYDRINLLVRSG